MRYEDVVKRIRIKAAIVFESKTSDYKNEFESYSVDDIFELLRCKVDKIEYSKDISETMFESDIVDALNWLVFLYWKKIEKKE